MALWEPHLAKAYGVAPEPLPAEDPLPPLPHPNTQRAVERRLHELELWLKTGAEAMARHQQRRPHARSSFSRIARMFQIAFDLKRLVLGLDSERQLPEKITCDFELTDLQRAYGQASVSPPEAAPVIESEGSAAPSTTPPEAGAPQILQKTENPPTLRCDAWSRWARQKRSQIKS